MSVSIFHIPAFFKTFIYWNYLYDILFLLISFTALAHQVLYTDDTFAYNIWINADDEISYYGFMEYETPNLVSTYE